MSEGTDRVRLGLRGRLALMDSALKLVGTANATATISIAAAIQCNEIDPSGLCQVAM